MRLINVHTLKLEQFVGDEVPPYAILSHTWGDDEVTLEYFTTEQHSLGGKSKGMAKIESTCQRAKSDGLNHAWVDTCCIDKTSSAELSEAINSMYLWYQRAEVCYAYLSDIEDRSKGPFDLMYNVVQDSRYFARGWTLQELIAPPVVVFFDAHWNRIFARHEIPRLLASITGIDESLLAWTRGEARPNLSLFCVARRMSWAAKRRTTRPEDEAYCLLGLFNVNMPLLYGEGRKAFQRLQEEIIRITHDHSIFAWETLDASDDGMLLAPSPANFRDGGRVDCLAESLNEAPYQTEQRGLRITLPLLPVLRFPAQRDNLAVLNCRYLDDWTGPLAIHVQGQSWDFSHDVFRVARATPDRTARGDRMARLTTVDINQARAARQRSILVQPNDVQAVVPERRRYLEAATLVRTGTDFAGNTIRLIDIMAEGGSDLQTGLIKMKRSDSGPGSSASFLCGCLFDCGLGPGKLLIAVVRRYINVVPEYPTLAWSNTYSRTDSPNIGTSSLTVSSARFLSAEQFRAIRFSDLYGSEGAFRSRSRSRHATPLSATINTSYQCDEGLIRLCYEHQKIMGDELAVLTVSAVSELDAGRGPVNGKKRAPG